MSYLLSVIIPTKNRQKYCLAAVKQILTLGRTEIQICVQDNSDDNSLEKQLCELKSTNIVYNFHPGELSFVDNFSEAVSLSTAEYICMIGDDDGVLPNIISATEYTKRNALDCLIPGLNSVYNWPSPHPLKEGGENGWIAVSPIHNKIINVNVDKAFSEFLSNGALDYYKYDLPKLYHGIVPRSILENIKSQVGTYFKGLTPDIYMATALALTCNKVEKTEFPITVSGICPRSGSADSATGRHTGELKDAPHFRGHSHYEWEEIIPAIHSVETIWAETLIKALKDFGAEKYISKINFNHLYATCLLKYPQFSDIILRNAKIFNINPTPIIYKKDRFLINIFNRLKNRLFNGRYHVAYGIEDIEKAVLFTQRYLHNNTY